MSKISKALDEAKRKRGLHAAARPAEGGLPPLGLTDVRYTQTQVVRRAAGDGVIPPTAGGEDPGLADCYALLRTQVLQLTAGRNSNTIMVTSVGKGEGKTLTAINLAMSMAKELVHTALLVDTNLRDPKVAAYLSLDAGKGLTDYLLHDVPISDLLINPGMSKFVVLPAGQRIKVSTEILGSPRMRQLVLEMKSRYPDRYVIFDCPHLLDMPDALVFSSYVDHVILVIEEGRTTQDDLKRTLKLLAGKPLLGIVVNKARKF